MTLKALAQSILDTHHADTKRNVPQTAARIGALRAARPGDAHVERLARAFSQLKAEIESHMWKEEMILFPMIMGIEDGRAPAGCGVNGPITQMNHEHREAKELLAQIMDALAHLEGIDPDVVKGCTWLNDDLYEHIRKEEEELFPGALKACGMELPASQAAATGNQ